MKISIIIVAFNNHKVLVDCIASINSYNDLGDNIEIIVVDNSDENNRVGKYIENISDVELKYIPSTNRGFGYGNNVGARVAHGELLLFLNPDTLLVEPVLKYMYDLFKSDQKVQMAGVKLLQQNKEYGFSFFFNYNTSYFNNLILRFVNKYDIFIENKMFTSGANIFIRKDTFKKCGMFDENIFMYCEEFDIWNRIINLYPEAKKVYCKNKHIIHLEGKTTTDSLFRVKQEMQSYIYIGKKYGLDYKKKVFFERNHYRLKRNIFKLVSKEKYNRLNKIVSCIDTEFLPILEES